MGHCWESLGVVQTRGRRGNISGHSCTTCPAVTGCVTYLRPVRHDRARLHPGGRPKCRSSLGAVAVRDGHARALLVAVKSFLTACCSSAVRPLKPSLKPGHERVGYLVFGESGHLLSEDVNEAALRLGGGDVVQGDVVQARVAATGEGSSGALASARPGAGSGGRC